MDLFTRIAKRNYMSRGYGGAGQDHADEMMEKTMPFPNGGYLGPGYVIGGAVVVLVGIALVAWVIWRAL